MNSRCISWKPNPVGFVALLLCPSAIIALTPLGSSVDPKRCMGTWFVQRQIPALAVLEAGARNGVELYTWDEAADRFDVQYTFNRRDAAVDAVTTVRQRGWVTSEAGTQWEVSPKVGPFFLPARLPFVILDVDPDAFMVCSGGLSSWMYAMTREREPPAALVESCLGTIEEAGFDMTKVLTVEHDR